MQITIDTTPITLSPDYDEYIDLMCAAVVKPGDPPIESRAEMVKKILADNYASNIQQHASVRPKSVASQIKEVEALAAEAFKRSVETAFK